MNEDDLHIEVEGHTTSTAHRLMHYDGVCNNIHGHNIEWNISVRCTRPDDETGMAVDFKELTDIVEKFDHAILLNNDDPLLQHLEDTTESTGEVVDLVGEIFTFGQDPTTEVVSERVAQEIESMFECVETVTVEMKETDKYSMSSSVV